MGLPDLALTRASGEGAPFGGAAGGTSNRSEVEIVRGRVCKPSLHFLANDRALIDHGGHSALLTQSKSKRARHVLAAPPCKSSSTLTKAGMARR